MEDQEEGAPTWKGFIVFETPTEYTVISNRDKQPHILLKKDYPRITGPIIMPDGHCCTINEYIFTPSRLYSACRVVVSDLARRKRNRAEKREQSKDSPL